MREEVTFFHFCLGREETRILAKPTPNLAKPSLAGQKPKFGQHQLFVGSSASHTTKISRKDAKEREETKMGTGGKNGSEILGGSSGGRQTKVGFPKG